MCSDIDILWLKQEKVMKDYLNFRFQQPYQQVMYNWSMLLEHKRWHNSEYIEVLPSLDAKDLTAFFPRILSRIFFECFIAGNKLYCIISIFACYDSLNVACPRSLSQHVLIAFVLICGF